jgi:hypothetical protein
MYLKMNPQLASHQIQAAALNLKGDWSGFVVVSNTARLRTDDAYAVLTCRFAAANKTA